MVAPAVRTLHHRDFPLGRLQAAKGATSVSVCLPARNEAATIEQIVSCLRRELVGTGLVDELVVIDDGSEDDTGHRAALAGAQVVRAGDVLAEHHPGPGKGQALWKSLHATSGDVVVWCDADIDAFGPRFVTGILGPLLTDERVSFAKGFYDRPLAGRPGEGGRVTELVARPIVALLEPELSAFVQPLSGEYGGRRQLLERLPFAVGYGVDLALLADVVALVGTDHVAQVDLGVRHHRNRRLHDLGAQSLAIMHTMLARADVAVEEDPRLSVPGRSTHTIDTTVLPPMVDVGSYVRRRRIA